MFQFPPSHSCTPDSGGLGSRESQSPAPRMPAQLVAKALPQYCCQQAIAIRTFLPLLWISSLLGGPPLPMPLSSSPLCSPLNAQESLGSSWTCFSPSPQLPSSMARHCRTYCAMGMTCPPTVRCASAGRERWRLYASINQASLFQTPMCPRVGSHSHQFWENASNLGFLVGSGISLLPSPWDGGWLVHRHGGQPSVL